MNERFDDAAAHDPLAGLEPPTPPSELQGRTLRAAAAALQRAPALDPWSRLWHSLPLRLAWAATVLVLLVGHLTAGTGARHETMPPETIVSLLHGVDGELMEIAGLPRIAHSALARMMWMDAGDGTNG